MYCQFLKKESAGIRITGMIHMRAANTANVMNT